MPNATCAWVYNGEYVYERGENRIADHFRLHEDGWTESFNFHYRRGDPASLRAAAQRALGFADLLEALRASCPAEDDIEAIVRLGVQYDAVAHDAVRRRKAEANAEYARLAEEHRRVRSAEVARNQEVRADFQLLRDNGHDIFARSRYLAAGYVPGGLCSRCHSDRSTLLGKIETGIGNRRIAPPCQPPPPSEQPVAVQECARQ